MTRYANLKARRASRASAAVVRSFPQPDQELTQKLESMFEELFELHGRKYSTLTLNEKRLVEFFCTRSTKTAEGKKVPDGFHGDIFHTLTIGYYAHNFLVKTLGEYFQLPTVKDFHIIEDVMMNPAELFGSPPLPYKADVFHNSLDSYPDYYIPVRESKGKAEIYGLTRSTKASDLDKYTYKSRESLFPNECRYSEYPVLQLITKEQIQEVVDVINKAENEIILRVTPQLEELFLEHRRDWREFKKKYGIEMSAYLREEIANHMKKVALNSQPTPTAVVDL